MDASNLAELAVDVQSRLDNAWMLFLSINSTIIGGVVLIQRTFNKYEKSVVVLIYMVITWMNYNVVNSGIDLLASIYTDLGKYQYLPAEPGYHVVQQMSFASINSVLWEHSWIIPAIYIGALFVTIGAVVLDEKLTRTTS